LHAGATGWFEDLFRVRYQYRALRGDFGPEERAYSQQQEAVLAIAGTAFYSSEEIRDQVYSELYKGIANNKIYFLGRQLTQGSIVTLATRYSGTGIVGGVGFTGSLTTVAGYGRALNLYDQGVTDITRLLSGAAVGK
jgi:hypothetical protein